MAIILGAAVGATCTIQLIAFRMTDYAMTIVAVGFILYVPPASGMPNISIIILGFGILFLGMNLMSESMEPLKNAASFTRILVSMENPLPGILVGALFTALIQSSSAFMGILIILEDGSDYINGGSPSSDRCQYRNCRNGVIASAVVAGVQAGCSCPYLV